MEIFLIISFAIVIVTSKTPKEWKMWANDMLTHSES